jgi:hypothetical protein
MHPWMTPVDLQEYRPTLALLAGAGLLQWPAEALRSQAAL